MTDATTTHSEPSEDAVNVFAIATAILERRKAIVWLGVAGAFAGLLVGLTSTRQFVSSTTFVPQGSEQVNSGLAAAASQFGLRLPTSGGAAWGPPVYVELLRSTAMLATVARDTVTVIERGGARVAMMELLKVDEPTPERSVEVAVRRLGAIVSVAEIRTLSAVRLSAATPWPSVSHAIVARLLESVNQFNLEKRKSQAGAERRFVEAQAAEAELALREAEDRLDAFLQRNKGIGTSATSPTLSTQRDRLQRDVTLRQQVLVTLLQSREDARIREVRDTPVLTVLEEPRVPVDGEPRGSIQKGILGGLVGAMLGVLLALATHWLSSARSGDASSREFFSLLRDVTPRFLKPKGP